MFSIKTASKSRKCQYKFLKIYEVVLYYILPYNFIIRSQHNGMACLKIIKYFLMQLTASSGWVQNVRSTAEGGKKADVVTVGSARFLSDYTLVLLQKKLKLLREGLES
jgi:hypothetical protein